ncbi:hypothetical protein SAMN05192549_12714 [Duganella sacchari]|uniref:RiboL-PSP-HEPN domain-containing protein n=1 Tax=Duganella sacchari TaxID=551987 RepID=A0A1M7RF94_9BURK|nr:hypothetical protein SAMN05192549_12714 [Duganella sacchari]
MEAVISPSELYQLDPRAKMFGWTPEERFALMSSVSISDAIPEQVHRQVVTAKNLIIHSCLYYPYNVTAIQIAFAALEMAIRLRTECEGHTVAIKGLRAAMQHAVRSKWISDEGLPLPKRPTSFRMSSEGHLEEFEPPLVRSYVEVLAEFMPKIRNELAHGSGYLHNGGASKVLIVNHLINQLFPSRTTISSL